MNSVCLSWLQRGPDVTGWRWEICVDVQHSIQQHVNKLVFNRVVRDGARTWISGLGASARWSQQQYGQILPAGTCQGSCIECEAQGSQGAFARAGWSLLLEFSLSIQIALAFSVHMSSGAAEWVWAPGVGLPMWVYSCTHSLLTGQSVLLGWESTCSQGDPLSLRACGYVSNSGTARGIYHPFIR